MTCTITQADLGKKFEDVDADVAAEFIALAVETVLGAPQFKGQTYAAWIKCKLDPCGAIRLLAQHLLAEDPDTDVDAVATTSESIGGVSVSASTAATINSPYGGTTYGRLYAARLAAFTNCQARRRSAPFGVGPRGVR